MPNERDELFVPAAGGTIKSQAQLEAERVAEAERLASGMNEQGPDSLEDEMDPRFKTMSKEERKARLAVVLDRGIVHERLKVDLPPQLHGEWVRRDPFDVDRMRTLGFWVDQTYATKRSIHSDGSSGNQVADVVFMVTTRENKEMIDEVRLEQQLRSARHPKMGIEEEKEKGSIDREIPTFSESNQRSVTAAEVRAALAKVDGQTAVQR